MKRLLTLITTAALAIHAHAATSIFDDDTDPPTTQPASAAPEIKPAIQLAPTTQPTSAAPEIKPAIQLAPTTQPASAAPVVKQANAPTDPENTPQGARDELAKAEKGIDRPVSGKIVFIIKGDGEIYLNGTKLETITNGGLVMIQTSISPGDILMVRARSKFVYRSFRIGFILDNGQYMDLAGLYLLGTEFPAGGKPDAHTIESAHIAGRGRTDSGHNKAWTDAGLPGHVTAIGLPGRNQWYTFAMIIR